MEKKEIPLFEFDPCKTAFINAENDLASQNIPPLTTKVAVVCFFKEAIEKYVSEHECQSVCYLHSELVDVPVYLDVGNNILFMQGCVGGPLAVAEIEILSYLGVKKIITCGGAGVLNELAVGHLMIPVSAVRDEGASYHYAKPSYEIEPDFALVNKIKELLDEKKLPYVEGKTWTTDAAYRETKEKVQLRRQQGCICVEMECASFFAVGSFRNVAVASVLYGGDSLSNEEWDNREWNKRSDIRIQLMNTIMEMAIKI